MGAMQGDRVPYSSSAKKRNRQAVKRNARNRGKRSEIRSAIKKVRTAGSQAEAQEAFRNAERLLDRAAQKRLVHPSAAARMKSRLQKSISGTAAPS